MAAKIGWPHRTKGQKGVHIMYCRNCGYLLPNGAGACARCGTRAGMGTNFCSSCGSRIAPGVAFCNTCGMRLSAPNNPGGGYPALPGQPVNYINYNIGGSAGGYPGGGYNFPGGGNNNMPRKSRVVAGLLGIFLGQLGIHDFYLGFMGRAIMLLTLSLIGWLLSCCTGGLSLLLVIFTFFFGLTEGIMILCGTIKVDGYGNPLDD